MFLSMHGETSDIDSFLFSLALKLGKSVAEVSALQAKEILQWQSYFKVRGTLEDLARRSAGG